MSLSHPWDPAMPFARSGSGYWLTIATGIG
jgi:hypothetical protein